jgi:hypothetical protein
MHQTVDIWSQPEWSIYQLFDAFTKAYRKVGNAAKEQEYFEKLTGFKKIITVDPEGRIKTREDMAKCLLKQGKFKDASVILDEANKLRDELATQKPAEKKKQVQAPETQELKPVGKGFEDPFPNMSEDDYVATLEFEFRNMIVDKLMRFTNWQKERVPQDVWQKAAELKKTAEADPILLDHEKRIIDYVDFTDYIRIFRFKKKLGKDIPACFQGQRPILENRLEYPFPVFFEPEYSDIVRKINIVYNSLLVIKQYWISFRSFFQFRRLLPHILRNSLLLPVGKSH